MMIPAIFVEEVRQVTDEFSAPHALQKPVAAE
jgi:hypothetical protein